MPRSQRYRSLAIFISLGILVIGIGLLFLTYTALNDINPSLQSRSGSSLLKKDLLFLGVTMIAGLPAIGIGTYLAYLGNQMRGTSQLLKGSLLMVSGSVLIVSCLVIPIIVWWMTQGS